MTLSCLTYRQAKSNRPAAVQIPAPPVQHLQTTKYKRKRNGRGKCCTVKGAFVLSSCHRRQLRSLPLQWSSQCFDLDLASLPVLLSACSPKSRW